MFAEHRHVVNKHEADVGGRGTLTSVPGKPDAAETRAGNRRDRSPPAGKQLAPPAPARTCFLRPRSPLISQEVSRTSKHGGTCTWFRQAWQGLYSLCQAENDMTLKSQESRVQTTTFRDLKMLQRVLIKTHPSNSGNAVK